MPSLDNIYDFYDLLKHEGFEFIIVTMQKGKNVNGEKESITNVDHFNYFKSNKSKKRMIAAMQHIAKELEEEIHKK